GRGERRPGAAGAPRAGTHWRGRSSGQGAGPPRTRGGRPRTDPARSQGRPGVDQRHAAVDSGTGAGAGRCPTARARCRHCRAALRGSIHPFEARIHDARPFPGQQHAAANIELLMRGSGINKSHEFCGKVQDAYSLRCAAQVHGAAREALRFVGETIAIEANSATDNPMVFADSGEIVSCGNFHGAPIALAADLLSAAVVPLATISERRTDRLVDPSLSGLPAFLTTEGGVCSGYMLAQVTAAAVASELKTLAHPAGVDTIPTSA